MAHKLHSLDSPDQAKDTQIVLSDALECLFELFVTLFLFKLSEDFLRLVLAAS